MSVLFDSNHHALVMDWFLKKVSLECKGTTETDRKDFSDHSIIRSENFYFSIDVFGHPICFFHLNIRDINGVYSRISFSYGLNYECFPYELYTDIIGRHRFDVMFDSVDNRVVLGNFFSRNSKMRDSLSEVLERQKLLPPQVLGAELWKIILNHGGLTTLLNIWEEIFQLDIAYLMRLQDPYCLDEWVEEVHRRAWP